jgi:hypothetical protein
MASLNPMDYARKLPKWAIAVLSATIFSMGVSSIFTPLFGLPVGVYVLASQMGWI